MELYLLRHAIADDRDPTRWSDDSRRPLTEKGRRRMRDIARGMEKMGLAFDLVLSSPYARARETAEIAAGRLHFEVIYTDHLTPEGSFEQLMMQILNVHPPPARVLLVGHEPNLSELACRLLAGQPGGWLQMKKGGLCKLEVEHLDLHHSRARMHWLLTPTQLRSMSGARS